MDAADGRRQPAGRGPDVIARAFEATRAAFDGMPLEGCTEAQRGRAAIMARVAGDLARTARRMGDPLRAMEQSPELKYSPLLLEFQNRLEEFEGRRRALREDLAGMAERR